MVPPQPTTPAMLLARLAYLEKLARAQGLSALMKHDRFHPRSESTITDQPAASLSDSLDFLAHRRLGDNRAESSLAVAASRHRHGL